MYGTWMSWWNVAMVILSVVIVAVSFYESRRSYRIATACFIALAVGSALIRLFPWFFGMRMADAFGPSPIPRLAWIAPLLMVVWYLLPALALTPVVPVGRAMKWMIILVGIQLALFLLPVVVAMVWGESRYGFSFRAIETIYFFLLWLRVHELRVKTLKV